MTSSSDTTRILDGVASVQRAADPQPAAPGDGRPSWRRAGTDIVAVLLVVVVLARPWLVGLLDHPLITTWTTRMIAVVVQALPFLVLGVTVSGAVAALVPTGWLTRVVPSRPGVAVPVASLAGGLLPGCECSSVPIAGRLTERGLPSAAAFAFMLAAPAINPVVLIATAVAFPGQPRVVVARYVASLATAVVVGLLWARLAPHHGWDAIVDRAVERMRRAEHDQASGRLAAFVAVARHDLAHAGGWLVAGAAVAASFQTLLPADLVEPVAENMALSIIVLSLLAVVLAVCSEADAFVAVGMPMFPTPALLAFLVVGPVVDIKLIALQSGVFGRAFAMRFAPVTFAVAVAAASIAGLMLR